LDWRSRSRPGKHRDTQFHRSPWRSILIAFLTDDHGPQGDVASRRIPVHGEWSLLRCDERHLRHCPMVVELGILSTYWLPMLVLVCFFFQIREQFDSLT